ncbi:uncharacterized protein AKAME5_001661000 [Lates japonicus]|uniref:Uncharacterized protein n=1 Tax=Lates japonicus TaxID=270547 RepID=A0AAD3N4F4_LATJO|nr:uncharacterized protein AKAME5_001661000 [Lates japonicus]
MKWCRLGGDCVTSSGSIDGTRVTIIRVRNVFTVTMSGLTIQSSGWYLCVKGDLHMPVHVTVTEKPTTTTSCLTTLSHTADHNLEERVQNSASIDPKSLIIPLSLLVFIVMVTLLIWFMLKKHNKTLNSSVSVKLMSYIIPLSVLIFIVMVTLFIWFLSKRNKHTEAESSATATAEEVLTYTTVKHKRKLGQAEEEVTYSNVKHMKKPSHKRSVAKSDEDVTYSSVVTVKQQPVQRV